MMAPVSRLLWTSLASVLLAVAAVGCSDPAPDVRVLRLGHGLSADHPVHEAMEVMAARVAEKSGGALQIEIYPSGQLGSERELLELLQIGGLAMTKVSSSVLEQFAPEFKVFSLPYLFRDDAHRFAFLEGPVGRGMLDETARYRLRGLTYYDAGSRSFYTTQRPAESPAALAGQKIRVQESQVSMQMVRALGGSPTPVSWGELYTALQQGVVDGAENNPPSFYLSRHYEVAPYYVLNEHTAVPDVLVIGTAAWESLTPQEQRWLQEAADESAVVERRLWQEATAEALAAVEAAGVQIIRPDKAAFAAAVEDMMAEAGRDPVLGPLIASIRAETTTDAGPDR